MIRVGLLSDFFIGNSIVQAVFFSFGITSSKYFGKNFHDLVKKRTKIKLKFLHVFSGICGYLFNFAVLGLDFLFSYVFSSYNFL
jgi:hypothetical protein